MKIVMMVLLSVVSLWSIELQSYAAMQMGNGDHVREKEFYNPQGRFGARIDTGYGIQPYVEHISSIPNAFDGYGFNSWGINAVTPEWHNISAWAGYGHKPEWGHNNKTYSEIFSKDYYRYGVKCRTGNQYLYLESIENRMYSFGVEWDFDF